MTDDGVRAILNLQMPLHTPALVKHPDDEKAPSGMRNRHGSACSCAAPLLSSIRFHPCARTSARISVSSGRAFAGAQASPPSGEMITFCPPRRFHVIGIKMVMVSPLSTQVSWVPFIRDFTPPYP